MTPTRLAELASIIYNHTTKIDDHFKDHDIATPSFDVDTPAVVKLLDELAMSKNAVLEASDELSMLLLGPVGFLTNLHVRSTIVSNEKSSLRLQ